MLNFRLVNERHPWNVCIANVLVPRAGVLQGKLMCLLASRSEFDMHVCNGTEIVHLHFAQHYPFSVKYSTGSELSNL